MQHRQLSLVEEIVLPPLTVAKQGREGWIGGRRTYFSKTREVVLRSSRESEECLPPYFSGRSALN